MNKTSLLIKIKMVTWTVFISLALQGCSLYWPFKKEPAPSKNSLGAMLEQPSTNPQVTDTPERTQTDLLSTKALEIPQPDLPRVIDYYRQAMETLTFTDLQAPLLQRLALLEAIYGEQQLAEGEDNADQYMNDAIRHINDWLALEPNHPDRPEMLYQLGKLYDLSGQRETSVSVLESITEQYPDFEKLDEIAFRLGEDAYSLGDYKLAQSFYRRAANQENSAFAINASYMLGWSHFKETELEMAFDAFDSTLAHIAADKIVSEDEASDQTQETDASRQSSIEADTLRALSLMLGYMGNADYLVRYYDEQPPEHAVNIFRHLAKHLLSKKRYLDAHRVHTQFQSAYPNHPSAADMGIESIAMLKQSQFFTEAFTAHADFYQQYAPGTPYYEQVTSARKKIDDTLPDYLIELASLAHKDAQRINKRNQSLKKIRPYFKKAIDWYSAFIEAYPQHAQAQQQRYLMAEALFSIKDFPASILAYENVAYTQSSTNADKGTETNMEQLDRRSEAGYKALTAYQNIITFLDKAKKNEPTNETIILDHQQWLNNRLASAEQFITQFPTHSAASDIRFQAAEDAFQLNAYEKVIALISPLIFRGTTEPKPETIQTSYLVQPPHNKRPQAFSLLGDAFYNLPDYDKAAATYDLALTTHGRHSLNRRWKDYYANSLHQSAKAAQSAGNPEKAANLFILLADKVPAHALASPALYDAGTIFAAQSQWDRALDIWTRLRKNYPKEPLNNSLYIKFAEIYQQKGEFSKAAAELNQASQTTGLSIDVKQVAALEAARLYEQAGESKLAIDAYRNYANTYPEPLENLIEAQYQLIQLYTKQKDTYRATFWFNRLKTSIANYKDTKIDGTAYAMASNSAIAGLAKEDFYQINLSLPLKTSFQKKQSAMKIAIEEYQALMQFETAPYYQEGIYQLGDIFHHLSQELLDAPKPSGLSELELEEYDILLEEQAYPFEEKAIEFHESNIQQLRSGNVNPWVMKSLDALKNLVPSQYKREARLLEWSEHIH